MKIRMNGSEKTKQCLLSGLLIPSRIAALPWHSETGSQQSVPDSETLSLGLKQFLLFLSVETKR